MNQDKLNYKEKPTLSFWQIWNMSFGFMGIQFGWGLQMANMSAIYNYLGAEAHEIPMLWLAAPLTGLIVQPLVGYFSDRTWNSRLGRRKPYFLVGAILSSLALLLMPNSSALWMAAGLLWILDASINITMEPFRAFVADLLPNKQHARGFTMQSVFIGAGAVIASALPWMMTNWFGVTDEGTVSAIPNSVRYSFYIGAGAFIGAVLYTIFKTKEYSPEEMKEYGVQIQEEDKKSALEEIVYCIKNMPPRMKKMALVQFFTWPGLFLMWFYFNDTVAYHIMGAESAADPLYREANEWGGICMAFKDFVTFGFAFAIPTISKKLGNKLTHVACLVAGAIGLILMSYWTDPNLVLVSMVGVGVAWASILSMPYVLIASELPQEKMGIYMGIFNFFIVLPEIIASLGFGWFMKNVLENHHPSALMIGGVLFVIAAALTMRVNEHRPQEA
jgi:maltose/moltooligosaccharide transporter